MKKLWGKKKVTEKLEKQKEFLPVQQCQPTGD